LPRYWVSFDTCEVDIYQESRSNSLLGSLLTHTGSLLPQYWVSFNTHLPGEPFEPSSWQAVAEALLCTPGHVSSSSSYDMCPPPHMTCMYPHAMSTALAAPHLRGAAVGVEQHVSSSSCDMHVSSSSCSRCRATCILLLM